MNMIIILQFFAEHIHVRLGLAGFIVHFIFIRALFHDLYDTDQIYNSLNSNKFLVYCTLLGLAILYQIVLTSHSLLVRP